MIQKIEEVGETAVFRKMRGQILVYLYGLFRKHPYAPVELGQIETDCGTNARDLNWNIVYLEKRGLVDLGKMVEALPYVACTASITTDGVDLVENTEAFRNLFQATETPAREEKPGDTE